MTPTGDHVASGRYHWTLTLLLPDCSVVWEDPNANVAGGDNSPWADYWWTDGVAISADAPYPLSQLRIVAGTADCKVRFYDIAGFITEKTVASPCPSGHQTWAVDITPDARFAVAIAAGTIRVYTGDGVELWSDASAGMGIGLSTAISNDGHYVAVGEYNFPLARVLLFENLGSSGGSLLWSHTGDHTQTVVDITGDGTIVFAGQGDFFNRLSCCNSYLFYAGADATWGTPDDERPKWSNNEPDDIFAVSMTDAPGTKYAYVGQTPADPGPPVVPDTGSDAYVWDTRVRAQTWATGVAFAAQGAQNSLYAAFGGIDNVLYFVCVTDPAPRWSSNTGGDIYAVKVTHASATDPVYHRIVAGGEGGLLYHFTNDHPHPPC